MIDIGCAETDLAKVHALHTFAAQGRADRRTGAGLASADNQLDELILGQRVLGHGAGGMTE